MLSNYAIAKKFVDGGTKGCSNRMTIDGNKLYSYACCIAIREDDGSFIISNRAGFLGGMPRSCTTSSHIGHIWGECGRRNKVVRLVDGWAENTATEWYVPKYPTHKTVWGLIKSFMSWRRSFGWEGEWLADIGARKVGWHYENGCLYAPNKTLVAKRKYVTHWEHSLHRCSRENCDECPAKFLCKTDGAGYYGLIFYIAKGKYAKKVKKYLHPAAIVEDLTTIEATDIL